MSQQLAEALENYKAGRLKETVQILENVLQGNPRNSDALNFMSVLSLNVGNPSQAVMFSTKALEIRPNEPGYWNNLGNALKAMGHLDEAIKQFRQALAFDKKCFDAWVGLGTALGAKGEVEEGIECFRKALRLDRTNAGAFSNYGNLLSAAGRTDEAIRQYEEALRLNPKMATAYFNLGNLWLGLGDNPKAIACYEDAIAAEPGFFPPYFQLGTVYKAVRQADKAVEYYGKALEIAPSYFKAYCELGEIRAGQGLLDEAAAAFDKALENSGNNPAVAWKESMLLPMIFENHEMIARHRQELSETIQQALENPVTIPLQDFMDYNLFTLYGLPYQGEDNRAIKESFARLCEHSLLELQNFKPAARQKNRTGKPKVGYVVTNHHEAAFCKFLGGLVNMPTGRFEHVVFASRFGCRQIEEYTGEAPVTFAELPAGVKGKIEAIQKQDVDVLFYLESGTDSENYLLSSLRLAPVQCTTWGYPDTTGIPAMDYFVSSTLIEPENAQQFYSEKLVMLDTMPVYYEKPALPETPKTRGDLGLPEGKTLYGCPQRLYKFHPDFDALLAGILRGDPDGVLVLVEDTHPQWKDSLLARFKQTMPDCVDRVLVLPKMPNQDFLGLLSLFDVMLDPLHFGGGNTAYEAFAVGTPTVTWPGRFMRGRITAGCYAKMGITEGTVDGAEAYVAMALKLGLDSEYRKAFRQRVLDNNAVLFEDKAAVEAMEAFFAQAIAAQGVTGSV